MASGRHSALMYHDVLRPGLASGRELPGADRYKLSDAAFSDHLEAIAARVDGPPDASDDPRALEGGGGWSLTFDDGGASAVGIAETLASRGWRGYFFVTSGTIGTPGFVDEDGVRELARLGHVVGSHSATHPEHMSSLPTEALLEEWRASVDVLSSLLARPVRTASVPGGFYSTAVASAAARAGIGTLFTSAPSRAVHEVAGCLVVGRYVVRRDTSAASAAGAAAGSPGTWLRQYAGWSARRPLKALGGERYVRLRRLLLSRGG